MISWVAVVVPVTPQEICLLWTCWVSGERNVGASSPGCHSTESQSMLVARRRGGVPVFSLPVTISSSRRRCARRFDGEFPIRPAARLS